MADDVGISGSKLVNRREPTDPLDILIGPGSFPGNGTVDGGVFTAHSIQVPWTYTQTTDPTDSAIGTAFHVDAHVTLSGGGFGPSFSTGMFGPRGIINVEGVVRYASNTSLFTLEPISFADTLLVTNTAGVARSLTLAWSHMSARQTLAQGATVTIVANDTSAGGSGFVDTRVFATTDAGIIDGTTNSAYLTSFFSQPAVFGNSSISGRIGLDIRGTTNEIVGTPPVGGTPYPWGSGEDVGDWDANNISIGEEIGVKIRAFTLGTARYGLDIEQFTGAGVKVGIRNASPYVATPSATQTISAVGNTILADAEYVVVSNTTGGSLTLTSTPTIADGQPGQEVEIINVGTQNVVIQDQGTLGGSNLRLVGTNATLTPRDSVKLRYNATVGDWVQSCPVTVVT